MKIKFLGAAGTVTGSSYLVTSNSGEQILVDLGLFQGPPEIDELSYKPLEANCSTLAGIVLTHAHLDHCGRLPMVESLGFTGEIFMTAPTADLAELALLDSAKIGMEDHPDKILYNKDQVLAVMKRFKTVEYDQAFNIGGFKITLRDAGHIIGSTSAEVEVDGRKVVFSGDLGNTPEDLSRPTENILSAEIVVMESTYGDRLHPAGNPEDIIQSEINAIEKSEGTLLIPAFSLERTQELLHIISHLKSNNLVRAETPVYLDSPMAQKATNIYIKYKSFLNDEIKKDFQTADPFEFPGMQIVRDRKESVALNAMTGAKVIIAGSGMMTGGRIVDHARQLLVLGNTRLLIVGYQAEGTLGKKLLSGEKEVKIGRQKIQINATISETQVMSSHADQQQLMNWLRTIQGVKRVILTHGETDQRATLMEKIKAELNILQVDRPELNQEIDLQ